ncbi:ABC transporter permease [Parapusillimonas sp. SGNA-6]|nr:ABC transporter permease [Parapusillimonas sp. SGNA-6]
MWQYTLRRLLVSVMVAFTVSVITFSLLRMAGDPAVALAGEGASMADIERIRVEYNLDRPALEAYWDWVTKALQGNFGRSFNLNADVSQLIAERLPVTFYLSSLALLFALGLSLPLGILAGLKPNSLIDRFALTISVVGQAMPTFWFGLILMIWVGLRWGLLPISGNEGFASYVMPAIVLGYYVTPVLLRLTRAGIIDAMSSDYIRTARAKGMGMTAVVFRHALRNAMIPVVSLAAVQFGFLLGGSIIVESVFSVNGIGLLAWQAIQRSDFDVMQAVVLVASAVYILLTFLADLLNAVLNPRLRTGLQ